MHVICFGNVLQGDDGFGIHVLEELRRAKLPESVRLFDGGIMGLGALGYFEECTEAIVVDAIASEGAPGKVRWLALSELDAPEAAFSAHAMDVHHLFHALPIIFDGRPIPKVSIVGAEIEPGDGAFSMELSAPIRSAVPVAVAMVLEHIRAAAPLAAPRPQ